MKVLFIAPRFHTNLYYRVKALQDAGHDVYFFILYKQHSECYDIIEPIVIKSSWLNKFIPKLKKLFKKDDNFWKTKFYIPNRKDFKSKITEINPDIVIIKNLQSILSLMSLWYARKFTNKVFLLIQTNTHYIKNRKKKVIVYILKKIFKVKKVITPLKNIYKQKNDFFVYIPFVIESKNFKKTYFKKNKINIISIGKYVKRKDHLILLKAINKLKDKYDLSLTLIGEKVDENIWEELEVYIKKNNLQKIVKMMYNIEYKKMLDMYKNYDLFVLPSYDEPAAYSIVEAMANKLSVICSDTCGTKCYIDEGKNGYIFESKNIKSLIDKIENIVRDKRNIEIMGSNSFEIIKSKHNFFNFFK